MNWDKCKNRNTDMIIQLYPDSSQFKYGFISNIFYLERNDLHIRVNSDVKRILQQNQLVQNQPFLELGNSSNNKPQNPKSTFDNSITSLINDSQILKVVNIPTKKLFPADLIHPIRILSNHRSLAHLSGTYMITDILIEADFTQSDIIPNQIIHLTKRNK